MKQKLFPSLDDVCAEFVLMQAWKKTSSYLRNHSWYADTLEIDFQSLRVPKFIREIQDRLAEPEKWASSRLDFVPAPKSQAWALSGDTWKPKAKEDARKKIRPLAHLALEDQVVATALLMCLADRVETRLGSPLLPLNEAENRKRTLAYGHRLFCDEDSGNLRHRWGSAKLYRLYFRDYQSFLERPDLVANQAENRQGREISIVQSDFSKFYDRVRPCELHQKLASILPSASEAPFLDLCRRVFSWQWRDEARAADYAKLNDIQGYDEIALPQGLVAAGFFANVFLLDFESRLRGSINRPIDPAGRLVLLDACCYVDDLRLVLDVEKDMTESEIEVECRIWLQRLLDTAAPGLLVEQSKTKATVRNRQKRFLVPQSHAAKRIQRDVSGAFDMLHGTELIGAIEGFFHTQKRYSSNSETASDGRQGLLVGISDMRDDTAARFAAGKFRRTFRSLRPLLSSEQGEQPPGADADAGEGGDEEIEPDIAPSRLVLSRKQLDERGQLFSAMLIEEWVGNPGNVRLLRIALDLYPDVGYLGKILNILRPAWSQEGGARGARREVLQYCLAELFRAGATETGQVADSDCLPTGISINAYHGRLVDEGRELLAAFIAGTRSAKRFPWYLVQQVFLYLAIRNEVPSDLINAPVRTSRGLYRHQRFARYVTGHGSPPLDERAPYLILARSAFGLSEAFESLVNARISPEFLRRIGEISPEVAAAAWRRFEDRPTEGQLSVARSMGLAVGTSDSETVLADLVRRPMNPFWEEESLLRLAEGLLDVPNDQWPELLTPWQIRCEVSKPDGSMFGVVKPGSVKISGTTSRAAHLFSSPEWCETAEERRRFQVGVILRFALRGSADFFGAARSGPGILAQGYRQPTSHWERQRYSMFHGRSAFGPAWIPLSSWVENLLFDLLRWPGAGAQTSPVSLEQLKADVAARLKELAGLRGASTGLSFLAQAAPFPCKPKADRKRPLRIGIVQSVIPDLSDYGQHSTDPQLNDPEFRLRHRRHFSAILEGVIQMLQIRETHKSQSRNDGGRLDLLVFPELAIHPIDIQPLILPFIRTHKCMVLFGQVYHPRDSNIGSPLINSCLWGIPEWNPTNGFQVRFVEQGKEHLAAPEAELDPQPVSFRPAQWIVEYEWTSDPAIRPLKLSASICYDATDLSLAADLRSRNDLYFVCALNQDVGTFDRMSEGLHYHMFQGVLVVNNGRFGGSSFYMPFGQAYHRQVFHLHGQPQASIAFAEVDPEKLIFRPSESPGADPVGNWKTPPANWQSPNL